jgi:hypothetical protein
VFPAPAFSFLAAAWGLAVIMNLHPPPGSKCRGSSNRGDQYDCFADNDLRRVPWAGSPTRVQILGQIKFGLSKSFDGLHIRHLPNTVISMEGVPSENVELNLPIYGWKVIGEMLDPRACPTTPRGVADHPSSN